MISSAWAMLRIGIEPRIYDRALKKLETAWRRIPHTQTIVQIEQGDDDPIDYLRFDRIVAPKEVTLPVAAVQRPRREKTIAKPKTTKEKPMTTKTQAEIRTCSKCGGPTIFEVNREGVTIVHVDAGGSPTPDGGLCPKGRFAAAGSAVPYFAKFLAGSEAPPPPKKKTEKLDGVPAHIAAAASDDPRAFQTPRFETMKCRGCGIKAAAKKAPHFEAFDVCAKCEPTLRAKAKRRTLDFDPAQLAAVHKTYSADVLSDKGRLRGFVVIDHKRYVAMSASFGPTGGNAELKPLYLKSEWKSGPTWPYAKKPPVNDGMPTKSVFARGGGRSTYFGITASCRGQEYVLGSYFDSIIAEPKPEPMDKPVAEKTVAKKIVAKKKGAVQKTAPKRRKR